MFNSLNDLILRNTLTVGSKLPSSNIKLPPKDFCYGKKGIPDKEGVSVVTRSWMFHSNSRQITPLNDFIKINKIAVKNKVSNHKTNKDFRKTIEILQSIPEGKKYKSIHLLPPKDFTYGLRNRTPTPIKDVLYYTYSNEAESEILNTYSNFKSERSKISRLQAKSTKHFDNLLMKRKNKVFVDNKPLYKIKKFLKIDSKVKDHLKNFKTFLPIIRSNRCSDKLNFKTEKVSTFNDSKDDKNTLNTIL